MQTIESRPEIVVPLAMVLFASEAHALTVEHQIEAELNRIFSDEWGPGWNFDPYEQSIDVFGAADLPENVAALVELGFMLVRIHAHAAVEQGCSCGVHWSRQ